MQKIRKKLKKELEHKRLHRSVSALAGLTGAASAATGVAAAYVTPSGLSGFFVDIGLESEPWIVEAAPIIAGVAVAIGTAAGILGFIGWLRERFEEQEGIESEESD
jgi:hypothetical protein